MGYSGSKGSSRQRLLKRRRWSELSTQSSELDKGKMPHLTTLSLPESVRAPKAVSPMTQRARDVTSAIICPVLASSRPVERFLWPRGF